MNSILRGDKSLDYGELFDVAFRLLFEYGKFIQIIFGEVFESNEARISEATEKIGFASEMLGRPS